MNKIARKPPKLPNLNSVASELVALVAPYCRLPHPNVVSMIGGAVFPSIRDQRRRISVDNIDGQSVFLDDNTTPRWAVLWAHGIGNTAHPTGWTFAHVWPTVKDQHAYTHLANLVMMPECLASLSDKNGPLCAYLRFHAQDIYGWHPKGYELVQKPTGYEEISWSYLENYEEPQSFIQSRLMTLKNKRVRLLRPLMGLEEAPV